MDIKKLNIKPQDIDKNTGRIILPSLDAIKKMTADASQAKPLEQAASSSAMAKSVDPLSQSSEMREAVSVSKEPVNTHHAVMTHPVTQKADHGSRASLVMTPGILTCLCVCFLTLPLGLMCVYLFQENREVDKSIEALSQRLHEAERNADATTISSLKEKARFNKSLTDLKSELANVNQLLESSEVVEVVEVIVPEKALATENEDFVYKDEEGNIIPEDEIASGDYVLEE